MKRTQTIIAKVVSLVPGHSAQITYQDAGKSYTLHLQRRKAEHSRHLAKVVGNNQLFDRFGNLWTLVSPTEAQFSFTATMKGAS